MRKPSRKSKTMGMAEALCCVVGLIVLLAPAIWAGPREQIPVGARAMSMGEAFSAVADDGTALFWNPAGIATLNHHEISSMYGDLFGLGISNGYMGYVYPLTDRYALGFDWFHIGMDDGELGFNQNLFKLSGAYRIRQDLSVGLNLKYLSSRTAVDFGPAGGSDGVGLDAGVLWTPRDWLRFGFTSQDFTDTRLRHDNGDSEIIYHRSTRVGAAVRPWKSSLVAVDFDDRFHLGAEYWVAANLALRAGMQKDLHTSEAATLSAGLGLAHRFLRIDYAFSDAPTLGSTHRFSLSAVFNLSRSVVDIREVRIRELFPALISHYASNPPADITLFNRSERSVEARVSLNMPDFMDAPSETLVVLRPQVVTQVEVPTHFNDQLLRKTSDRIARAVVTASYVDDRKTRSSKESATTTAYARGAVRWGSNSVAAFVTSTDAPVDRFARGVVRRISDTLGRELVEEQIFRAAAVFDAIGAAGVRYVPDAHNPYSTVSLSDAAVDNVQFPRDLLASKTGDCDDCSILYCSLLENLGIATSIVDVPGHLLMMFDSGIHPRHRLGLALPEEMTVVWHDRVWIPVEATMFGSSFAAAWKQGAARISSLPRGEPPNLIDIHRAWNDYPPPGLPVVSQELAFDISGMNARLREEQTIIEDWRTSYLASTYEDVIAPAADWETVSIQVQQLALAGQMEQAKAAAAQQAIVHPEQPAIWIDFGNVFALAGEYDSARICFDKAISLSPDMPVGWFNRALMEVVSNRADSAAVYFQKVRALCPDPQSVEGALGLGAPEQLKGAQTQDPAALLWEYLTSRGPGRDDLQVITKLSTSDPKQVGRLLCWGKSAP